MQQQISQQEQYGNQHQQMAQPMMICPIQYVYEAPMMVPQHQDEQIQRNQVMFNVQNTPPWIQNRPQNQVVYVQQAPNNYQQFIHPHMMQNPIYHPQLNYQIQQPMMTQDGRQFVQIPNLAHYNAVQGQPTQIITQQQMHTEEQNDKMPLLSQMLQKANANNNIRENHIIRTPAPNPHIIKQPAPTPNMIRPNTPTANMVRSSTPTANMMIPTASANIIRPETQNQQVQTEISANNKARQKNAQPQIITINPMQNRQFMATNQKPADVLVNIARPAVPYMRAEIPQHIRSKIPSSISVKTIYRPILPRPLIRPFEAMPAQQNFFYTHNFVTTPNPQMRNVMMNSQMKQNNNVQVETNANQAEINVNPAERNSNQAEINVNPAERNSNPAERNANPAERNANLAVRNTNPSERIANPAERNANLAESNANLAERNANPAERNANLAERIASPAERIANPAVRNANPAERIASPAERIANPAGRNANPAERNANSAERNANLAQTHKKTVRKQSCDGFGTANPKFEMKAHEADILKKVMEACRRTESETQTEEKFLRNTVYCQARGRVLTEKEIQKNKCTKRTISDRHQEERVSNNTHLNIEPTCNNSNKCVKVEVKESQSQTNISVNVNNYNIKNCKINTLPLNANDDKLTVLNISEPNETINVPNETITVPNVPTNLKCQKPKVRRNRRPEVPKNSKNSNAEQNNVSNITETPAEEEKKEEKIEESNIEHKEVVINVPSAVNNNNSAIKEETNFRYPKKNFDHEGIEVLTHVLDGYIIQESNVAFPIYKPIEKENIQVAPKAPETHEPEVSAKKDDKTDSAVENEATDTNKTPTPWRSWNTEPEAQKEQVDINIDDPFANIVKSTVQTWTIEQLVTHLAKFGWNETASKLQDEEIDGESLLLVNRDQLVTIGVCEEHADEIAAFTNVS